MPFIWFLLGGAVVGVIGVKIATKAVVGLSPVLVAIDRLPPECKAQFDATLEHLTPEEVRQWLASQSASVHTVPVHPGDLVSALQLTPEQQDLLHQHISQVPPGGHVSWTAEDAARDLHLSPQQVAQLQGLDHPQTATAGALWTHHGYRPVYAAGQAADTTWSVPAIHTAYDTTDPSDETPDQPSKAFANASPGRLAAVLAANTAMRQAIDTLIGIGVMPRWVLQTANRFVHLSLHPGNQNWPPIATAYDGADPSSEAQPSPSKAFSASLAPAQLASERAANDALRHAIGALLSIGVKPRWILQTANRFVHVLMATTALGPVPAAAAGALWTHHGYRPVYGGYFGPY